MKGPATELIHAGEVDRRRAGAADDADLRDDDLRVRERAGGASPTTRAGRRSTSTRATTNPTVVSASRRSSPRSIGAEAALLFSSGHGGDDDDPDGACSQAGDEVVCSAAIYGGTLHLLQDLLARFGVTPRFVVARGARGAGARVIGRRRGSSGSSRRSTRRCAAWTSQRDRRCLPGARRALGHRQHVREPDQPAAARARRRPGDAERDQVPERPQRCHRRRGHRPGRRWSQPIEKARRLVGTVMDPQPAYALGRGLKTLPLRIARTTPTRSRWPSSWPAIAASARSTIPGCRRIRITRSRSGRCAASAAWSASISRGGSTRAERCLRPAAGDQARREPRRRREPVSLPVLTSQWGHTDEQLRAGGRDERHAAALGRPRGRRGPDRRPRPGAGQLKGRS